jgi:hypothetical protein
VHDSAIPQMLLMRLTGFSGLEVAHCPAAPLGLDALFLLCPGTQHGQFLRVGDEPHVFKRLDGNDPLAG